MSAAILARRGERIVPEPLMEQLVDRMNAQLDAIADEVDAEVMEPCS